MQVPSPWACSGQAHQAALPQLKYHCDLGRKEQFHSQKQHQSETCLENIEHWIMLPFNDFYISREWGRNLLHSFVFAILWYLERPAAFLPLFSINLFPGTPNPGHQTWEPHSFYLTSPVLFKTRTRTTGFRNFQRGFHNVFRKKNRLFEPAYKYVKTGIISGKYTQVDPSITRAWG